MLDATISVNPREVSKVVELGSEGPHVLVAELYGSEAGNNVTVVGGIRSIKGLSSERGW